MAYKLNENHLSYFFILLIVVFALVGSQGLALTGLAILYVGVLIITPIKDHFLVTNQTELEKLKEEINIIKLELNTLKIQSGVKTLR